jgi:glucose-1-phosphate thymidylyltransferase
MSAGADRPAGERASRLDAIPRADVLALIPAAGRALRLGARETSKEILPVGDRIACQDLLQAFDAAGIRRGLLLTRREKLDVPRRIAALGLPSLRLATLLVPQTPSVPHTIDRAWPFLRHRTIAFGFPDVLLEPVTVFRQLLRRHADTRADLVLALFPAAEPERSDLVAVDGSGRILEVVVKRPGSALRRTWMAAVWSPSFTSHLHRELADPRAAAGPEIQLGHLVQSALEAGLVGRAIDLPSGRALDIGTPEALAHARSIGGR